MIQLPFSLVVITINKREKETIQLQLEAEEDVLHELGKQYEAALAQINEKIKLLQADELTQSKAYQLQYQQALKGQIEGILEKLHGDEYSTIQGYLSEAYKDGYIGTMYSIAGQGIPLIMPIDQKAAVKAILTDSKISKGLYTSLGVDTSKLKKSIRQEITRGIATGQSYTDIARNVANVSKAPLSRAKTIVRTEGHRIQQASTMDAQEAAKKKGCDVVKQWDSTLDGKTRDTHRELDGQIREIDELFEANGKEAKAPGYFGDPAEDCNCRCASLTRAKWALDEDELNTLKKRAEFFGLDKTDGFNDYKKKYLKAVETMPETKGSYIQAKNKKEAEDFAKQSGVKYVDYSKLPLETANELNKALVTLPDDVRPVFVGDSATLEKYWGGKLPRSSKNYYGVTIDTFDGIHLGFDEATGKNIRDFETSGYMVGISSSYKTADKITAAKVATQARYQERHNGHTWFFNVSGETTPFHEMGHVYANTKGLPEGFEHAAVKWATETKCDMLSNPSEAWAEAWASYYTGTNELPDYIKKFVDDVAKK